MGTPLQVVHVAHGVQPAPPDAVYGHHSQGVALSQPGVQGVPGPPAVGPGGPGDADILIYARKRHAGGQRLLALGFRVALPASSETLRSVVKTIWPRLPVP